MNPPSSPQAAQQPPLGLYRHYKGRDYRLLHVARHSETEEQMAVYQQCYGDEAIWVRPLPMFCESLTLEDKSVPRFSFLG